MDHVHSEHVAADPDRLFAAISDPGTLARFVPQLTRIDPQGDGQVGVEARYEGHTQRGEASFSTDADARTVEWGSASGYKGSMRVQPDGDGSMLTLSLTTAHVDHADHDIAATLDAIRRL